VIADLTMVTSFIDCPYLNTAELLHQSLVGIRGHSRAFAGIRGQETSPFLPSYGWPATGAEGSVNFSFISWALSEKASCVGHVAVLD
jgi:hypothetical protein